MKGLPRRSQIAPLRNSGNEHGDSAETR